MFQKINSQKRASDRFIPLRMEVDLNVSFNQNSSHILLNQNGDSEFLNTAKIRYNHKNFQNALREIFHPLDKKILNFFPPKKFTPDHFSIRNNELWPVKLRKKPVIGPPEIVLDMPNFDTHICHHVADWSSKNCLATIFDNEVHMWHSDNEAISGSTITGHSVINCIKWNREGTRFAVGLIPNRVGVWDVAAKKVVHEAACCLFCQVVCIQWVNDKIITGCNNLGVLTLYTSTLKPLKKIHIGSSVLNIAVSCNNEFIAVSSMNKYVYIFRVRDMEGRFRIKCRSEVRALAWHPWKFSILAIGHWRDAGQIVLWNVNTCKQISYEKKTSENVSIGALTFNPISGELVASYFVETDATTGQGACIIFVLSNIDRTEEELHLHNGPILYLLWGNGGRTLASASGDENLCLWKFFDSNKATTAQRRSKKSVVLNSPLQPAIR